MPREIPTREKAAQIIADAGGRIVGRTRLQKAAYLLELAQLGDGFHFSYNHYGPYSEELASAVRTAEAFDLISVKERPASWGGSYSIFEVDENKRKVGSAERAKLLSLANTFSAIELELAATAAYLSAVEEHEDPWGETNRLKPEKAGGGRLERAQAAYQKLLQADTTGSLPKIV